MIKIPDKYRKFIHYTAKGLEISINTPEEAKEFLKEVNTEYHEVYGEDFLLLSEKDKGDNSD